MNLMLGSKNHMELPYKIETMKQDFKEVYANYLVNGGKDVSV